jgi:hypothetical protein
MTHSSLFQQIVYEETGHSEMRSQLPEPADNLGIPDDDDQPDEDQTRAPEPDEIPEPPDGTDPATRASHEAPG